MNTEPHENQMDNIEFPTLSNDSHAATKRSDGDAFDWASTFFPLNRGDSGIEGMKRANSL
jgi:hypothetical protein